MLKVGSEYVAHDLLGSGATGEVWRGTDGDGRPVAIKVLRPEYSGRRDVVRRFIQERDLLTDIDHPHVVGVHDLVYDRSTLAIVMDLVEGGDLLAALFREGPFVPARVRAIGADVAMGLAAIHAADIVHLDLKPANVLLSRQDGVETALIADLGVSQLARGRAGVAEHPRFGTPQYTAPEIVTGGQVGSPADVYALGLLMVEMLQGRPAFENGSDVLGVLDAQVDQEVPRPAGADDETWSAIAPMLAKDPVDRPTALEAALSLGAPAEGLGDSALPVDGSRDAEDHPEEPMDRPLFPGGVADTTPEGTRPDRPVEGPRTTALGHRTSLLRSAQTVALDQAGPRTVALPSAGAGDGGTATPSQPPRTQLLPLDDARSRGARGGEPGRRSGPRTAILVIAGVLVLIAALGIGANLVLPLGEGPEPTTASTTTAPEPTPSTSASIPPDAIMVPDVLGMTEKAARGQIHGGLRVDVVSVEGTSENDGTVVGIDPPAGSPLAAGDTVTLEIARELATLPLTELSTAPTSGTTQVGPVSAGGTSYPASLVLEGPEGIAESETFLQKRYLRLDGGVTVPDGAADARVQILLDQVPVFDETVPAGTTVPLDLDVRDVNQVQVTVTTSSGGAVEAALTEPVLHGEKGRVPGS